MHIPITGNTSSGSHVGWVGDVEEDDTTIARHLRLVTNTGGDITSDGTNSHSIAKFLLNHNVVGSSDREFVPCLTCVSLRGNTPVTGKIRLSEDLWVGWVKSEELGQIEELDTMSPSLGSNNQVTLNDSDFSPSGANGVPCWETSEIYHLSLGCDLDEGSTIELANGNKFSSIGRGPSPRRGGLTLDRTASIGVRKEVVEIHLHIELAKFILFIWNGVKLTFRHLKVLLLSPGIAAAKPLTHLVNPSSGNCELSMAPEASSASHWSYFSQLCSILNLSILDQTYSLDLHDLGMLSTRKIFLSMALAHHVDLLAHHCRAEERKGVESGSTHDFEIRLD